MQGLDTGKAIHFVVAFLPGFLSLALADAVTGLPLTEFEFIYLGIALSVLIYFLANGCYEESKKWTKEEKSRWPAIVYYFIYVSLVFTVAFFISTTTKYDLLTKGVNAVFGDTFLKLSEDDVFHYVLKHRENCSLYDISERSPHYKEGGNTKWKPPDPHKPWVVVREDNGDVYEGNVRFFSSRRYSTPSIYLAPACSVAIGADGGTPHVIQGNGVFISDVKRMEFVDIEHSKCAKLYRIKPIRCDQDNEGSVETRISLVDEYANGVSYP